MGTLSGEATLIFIFSFLLSGGDQLLKKRICSSRSQLKFFSLKVDPFMGRIPVAQWVKRWPTDLAMPGSSPA